MFGKINLVNLKQQSVSIIYSNCSWDPCKQPCVNETTGCVCTGYSLPWADSVSSGTEVSPGGVHASTDD